MLKIYNSLTKQIEEFKPINPPHVGLYTCGPTVYNFQHIGNFRAVIFADILYRVLKANNYQVESVRNITDIDDKIIKGAKERNLPIKDFSQEYEKAFFADLDKLNILPVNHTPHATEYVGGMIKFIEELIKKGLAYVEEDGSVYFDISKFPEYGKLSGIEKRELKTGTRILSDEYAKDDVQDFALWKAVEANESEGYPSPWGRGRPGWHIECSVMSQTILGDTFDIHAGGIDLLFPHHENEIAQSEGKTGKKFVNYFIHNEHLLVDNEKMSKSKGNFYLLKDIEEKGFDPQAFRYLALNTHYRDKLNFTWESLEAAQNALTNIRETVRDWDSSTDIDETEISKFQLTLNDDLNTSKALAVVWGVIKSDMDLAKKSATLLKMDEVLGLGLDEYIAKPIEVPEEVKKLLESRESARSQKDFSKSDEIRIQIKKLGFELEDTPTGAKVKKISE